MKEKEVVKPQTDPDPSCLSLVSFSFLFSLSLFSLSHAPTLAPSPRLAHSHPHPHPRPHPHPTTRPARTQRKSDMNFLRTWPRLFCLACMLLQGRGAMYSAVYFSTVEYSILSVCAVEYSRVPSRANTHATSTPGDVFFSSCVSLSLLLSPHLPQPFSPSFGRVSSLFTSLLISFLDRVWFGSILPFPPCNH